MDSVGSNEPSLTRVVFELDVDDDGWPPVSGERLWAFDLGGDRYRIDNVPWFVADLAVGDVVLARSADPNSYPVFVELVAASDHVTVRIICLDSGPLAGDLQRVADIFSSLGVHAEGAQQFGMVALDIPGSVDLEGVVTMLEAGARDGSWEYEEGRITAAWARLSESGSDV